jgi:hypothetical protein
VSGEDGPAFSVALGRPMDALISVADIEAAAHSSLDPGADAYYADGASDEEAPWA